MEQESGLVDEIGEEEEEVKVEEVPEPKLNRTTPLKKIVTFNENLNTSIVIETY